MKNLRKSRAQLMRILVREGVNLRVYGMFFKAVVQVVLLFGSETWVMTPCMEWELGIFQRRGVQHITGRQPRRHTEGGWDYPPLVTAMEEAVFEEIGVYILKRQNKVAQYISMRPILDLCERLVRRPGAYVSWMWWEQEGLDIAGDMYQAVAAVDGEEERSGEEAVQ